jgi:hypothetical protein
MRPVLDNTDILEHPSSASQCHECHESSQHEGSPFLAWLARLCTPVPRLRPRRQERCALGTPRFEAPLDILAREYPDIHLRVMSGMG